MTIDFGSSDAQDHELRRHRKLERRQETTLNSPTPTVIYHTMSSSTSIATVVNDANLPQKMINQTLASLSALQHGLGLDELLS